MTVSMERGFDMTKGEQIFIIILQLVAIFMFVRIIAATAGCAEVDHPVGWQDIVVDAAAGTAVLVDVEEKNTLVGEAVNANASEMEQNDVQEPVAVQDMGIDLPGGKQALYDCETIDSLTCCTTAMSWVSPTVHAPGRSMGDLNLPYPLLSSNRIAKTIFRGAEIISKQKSRTS